ncbi:hypothetical protein ACHAXR_002776 [Thalassiosira sp. AJA248-18]
MDHRNQTGKHGGGARSLMAAAASLLFIVGAASLYVSSNSALIPALSSTDAQNNQRRGLSLTQLWVLKDPSQAALTAHKGCQVTNAELSPIPIAPTWQASFPGSGARMTWILVEALTGIQTNDDFDSHERGYENVVAVKTHYPVKDVSQKRRFQNLDKLFGRAMVILRNPMNAIPSYFNFRYEQLNHLPNHSTRGPNEDWVKYRDNKNYGLSVQILEYERFVEHWMEKFPEEERRDRLMVSYEDLTDNHLGPLVATRIADFLAETDGVNPVALKSIPCAWETIVDYKHVASLPDQSLNDGAPVETFVDPKSLRTGPKVRPYTEQNLTGMMAMIQRLLDKYSYDEDFVSIMVSYYETLSSTAPQE